MRKALGIAVAGMLATASSSALAQAGWRVSEASGPVTIRRGEVSEPARRGAALSPGDTVLTGQGGRAVLVQARDFVTVSANSRLSVPATDTGGGIVKMIQGWGNAIFRIEKLKTPHFGVNTPYLAAVVKGTTFSVTVDATGTSLQVTEGVVEVGTLDGGAKDMVRPGDVATIGAGDVYRLRVTGETDRTVDSPARPVTTGATAPAAGPVIALAAPVATVAVVEEFDAAPAVIAEPIASKPFDLGGATGGMVTGSIEAAALFAAVRVEAVAAAGAVSPAAPVAVVEAPTSAPSAPVADAPQPATLPPAEPASPPAAAGSPTTEPAAPVPVEETTSPAPAPTPAETPEPVPATSADTPAIAPAPAAAAETPASAPSAPPAEAPVPAPATAPVEAPPPAPALPPPPPPPPAIDGPATAPAPGSPLDPLKDISGDKNKDKDKDKGRDHDHDDDDDNDKEGKGKGDDHEDDDD